MKRDVGELAKDYYARLNAALRKAEDDKYRSNGSSLEKEVERAADSGRMPSRTLNPGNRSRRKAWLQESRIVEKMEVTLMTHDEDGSLIRAQGDDVEAILDMYPEYVRVLRERQRRGYLLQDEIVDYLLGLEDQRLLGTG